MSQILSSIGLLLLHLPEARISHLAYQEVSLTSSQQSTLSPLGAGHTFTYLGNGCPPHSLPSICHTVFSIWGQGPIKPSPQNTLDHLWLFLTAFLILHVCFKEMNQLCVRGPSHLQFCCSKLHTPIKSLYLFLYLPAIISDRCCSGALASGSCPTWPVPPGPGSCRPSVSRDQNSGICFCLCVLRVFSCRAFVS